MLATISHAVGCLQKKLDKLYMFDRQTDWLTARAHRTLIPSCNVTTLDYTVTDHCTRQWV